jgi:asparagine synthase (glutamine-hydrolysing)
LLTTPFPDYYYSRVSSPFSYFNRHKSELYLSDFASHVNSRLPGALAGALFNRVQQLDLLDQMLYVDTKTWLPDDLLIKADKITMANSLELRVPLLDHVLLEFAASLPAQYKVKGLGTKRVLKRAFVERVPREIIERKKTGFPIPYAQWFRSHLRDYVHDVLLGGRTLGRGYFAKAGIEKLLSRYDQGEPLEKEIFSLLTLELWHRQFVDAGTVAVGTVSA